MKIAPKIASLFLLVAMLAGIFAAVISGEAGPADIPIQPAIMLEIDVVTRDRDLLHITSNWPDSFSVQNVSHKDVNGFIITIITADPQGGGPGKELAWGGPPQKDATKNHHLRPLERVTVPIRADVIPEFVKYGYPFLYVQLATVWYDNNPDEMMSYGATMVRDKDNPNQFNAFINSKGIDVKTGVQVDPNVGSSHVHFNKKKPEKNHASKPVPVPHMKHSNRPPASLVFCCNREE